MKEKDRFLKVYANLSLDVRREIIALVQGKPITWNVAYEEIEHETKQGKEILQKLLDLELI
jgi:hypothetical protein